MKILRNILLLSTALAGTALIAQDYAPAPTVTSTPPPPAPAAAPEPVQVDGLIHVQQLPTPAQLTRDAEAEGMAITRMDQLSDRIIVTYRYASGNTRTFAYTATLPTNPNHEIAQEAPPPARSLEQSYTVIYTEPAPVYYYPRYVRSYDSYWPRSTFSFGIGFGRNYGTYGHHGHYGRPRYSPHHGHHHRGRGDWRR
jgi:hypothetical protein